MSGSPEEDRRRDAPHDLVVAALREALQHGPSAGRAMPDVLEVGCGSGAFAARLVQELPGLALLAVDESPGLVQLARARGVPAQVQDVQHLLAPDAAYDVVLALWVLHQVPDLDRGLAEVRRVLRPGGTLVAATNGDDHLADLRRAAGGEVVQTTFSSENGEAALRRHFDSVERRDLESRAVFTDRREALGYLSSTGEDVAWSLPDDGWPREHAGYVTLFTAA